MCDTPVLLIFFNRPDTLEKTFEQIRTAKPQKLYLAQDGPRNAQDTDKVIKCREIVKNIDWDCQVFTNYCETNQGCGRGPFNAINWVFENEDRAIILEDDCVASQSFFSFCDAMLEKYKDDERIFMISGCNMELKTNIKESYFFAHAGTNWGWATWKRNWLHMDYACSWIKDPFICKSLQNKISGVSCRAARAELAAFATTNTLVEKGHNISYWDVQWQATRYLNNQVSIVPSINLITNIGLGPTSTHAHDALIPKSLNKRTGKINFCYNERYEFDKEHVHPLYCCVNTEYDKKVYRKLYPGAFYRFVRIVLRKLGISV